MKKKLLLIGALILSVGLVWNLSNQKNDIEKLRKKHAEFLKTHPINKTLGISKKERKAIGLPPNQYIQEQWLLSVNPKEGRPTPENLEDIYQDLKEKRLANKAPGDSESTKWIERGPNNVGGRTRVVFFDPNDNTNETVFAGGVSGGLWKNTNISNPSSSWVKVESIDNVSVSSFAIDPNNSNIWYIGTGELYTSGDVIGNGVYRTIDGGASWTRVLNSSGATVVDSDTQYRVPGIYYVTDIIVRDKDGNSSTTNDSEVFVSIGSSGTANSGTINTFLGVSQYGVHKSSDNGNNWTKLTINNSEGRAEASNDFEIGADNSLWMSTTRNVYGNNGGAIYQSTDGTNFVKKYTVPDARRTEIAVSATNPNVIYMLAQGNNTPVILKKTTSGFNITPQDVDLPDDPDGSVSSADFTRGQAFYDLEIEIDPTDDNIVYLGGINLHRSPSGGGLWTTMSYWSAGWSTSLPGSLVHADQHKIVFKPGNTNHGLFGTDGGVYYTTNMSDVTEGNNTPSATSRNNGFNVTQFYTVGVAPTAAFPGQGDYIIAGAQDNGTQLIANANSGINPSTQAAGGDGAFSFFDQDGTDKYFITNYVYNQNIQLYNYVTDSWRTIDSDGSNDSNGSFINNQALDSRQNVLYSDYSNGSNYRIRRYANLLSGTVTNIDLSNALLDARPSAINVSPRTTTVLVGTRNSKLLKLTGDNPNFIQWVNISGSGFLGSISDIEFGETDDEIFVTMHNYGVSNIWYTSDGGTTWVEKEGNLPDMPVRCILQNPLNKKEVIIGTDIGVWKTNDFSVQNPSWEQSYNGMSTVKVTDLDVRDDNKVFAATYGRGIFSAQFLDAAASVNDVIVDKKLFTIYPTTNSGSFTIFAKNTLGKSNVIIHNIRGQKVYDKELDFNSNDRQKIEVQQLKSGVYIVKIIGENNKQDSRKIIIK